MKGNLENDAAIKYALWELVLRCKQREIFELFGKLPADRYYDYKKSRN